MHQDNLSDMQEELLQEGVADGIGMKERENGEVEGRRRLKEKRCTSEEGATLK